MGAMAMVYVAGATGCEAAMPHSPGGGHIFRPGRPNAAPCAANAPRRSASRLLNGRPRFFSARISHSRPFRTQRSHGPPSGGWVHLSLSKWHATHATVCRRGVGSLVLLSEIPLGWLGAVSSPENPLGWLGAASGSAASLRSGVYSASADAASAAVEEGEAPSGKAAWPLLPPLSERARFTSSASARAAPIGLSRWLRIHSVKSLRQRQALQGSNRRAAQKQSSTPTNGPCEDTQTRGHALERGQDK